MAETGKCEICKKVSNKKCAKCWNVFYCSKEHQTIAWKQHQKVCRPFKICINEQLGRYVVATKPIQDGEVVFKELPLVENRGLTTCCMGCLKVLDTNEVYLCEKCGWALCSKECENNPNHKPECYYFSRRGRKVSAMECVTSRPGLVLLLRCLYQKKFNTEVWQKLNLLKPSKREIETDVLRTGLNILLNDIELKNEFSEEEIRNVWGIIDGNIYATDTNHVAVYEFASLFEHSCKANCRRVFNSKRKVIITAATSINEGEHLSVSYIPCLLPTFERQKLLQEEKFFTCQCNRCVDVTEFGTNFSALKCQNRYCDGIVLPETFLIQGLNWTCNKCNHTVTAGFINSTYEHLHKAYVVANDTLDYEFIKINEKLLPKYHSYIVNMKFALFFILDDVSSRGATVLSDRELRRKIGLCLEMMEFLLILVPAEKKLRGDVLLQLQECLKEIYKRKKITRTLGSAESISILKQRQSLLREVIEITRFKYGNQQEHHAAKKELKKVEDLLASINQTIGVAIRIEV